MCYNVTLLIIKLRMEKKLLKNFFCLVFRHHQ
jgi:hypothetical protein